MFGDHQVIHHAFGPSRSVSPPRLAKAVTGERGTGVAAPLRPHADHDATLTIIRASFWYGFGNGLAFALLIFSVIGMLATFADGQ